MKTKWTSLVGVAVAFAMAATSAFAEGDKKEKKEEPKFEDVTVEQLQAAIKDGKVAIIDANGAAAYNKAHIPGAVHYRSLKKKGLKTALPKDKSALVVAYCGGPQ